MDTDQVPSQQLADQQRNLANPRAECAFHVLRIMNAARLDAVATALRSI